MRTIAIAAILCIACCSCTSIKVSPIPYDQELSEGRAEVAIIDNPRVIVTDFVPIMEAHFAGHGIKTRRVAQYHELKDGEYGVQYVARQTWDIVTYLCDADMTIFRGREIVAAAKYHLVLGGGFDLSKYESNYNKLIPLYNALLENYPLVKSVTPHVLEMRNVKGGTGAKQPRKNAHGSPQGQ